MDNKSSNQALLPAGLNDLLPEEATKEAQVISRLLGVFRSYGYDPVKPPLIEFEESMLADVGQALEHTMFRLVDPLSQRTLCLRSDITIQIARIESGLQDELKHGNLNSTRTIIDVRDAMESYYAALEFGEFGAVYNIGGDTVITIGEFLDILKQKAKCHIKSSINPELLRPADITLQIPDTSKFENTTGWKPKYSFNESVENLLNYCRDLVSQENNKD